MNERPPCKDCGEPAHTLTSDCKTARDILDEIAKRLHYPPGRNPRDED